MKTLFISLLVGKTFLSVPSVPQSSFSVNLKNATELILHFFNNVSFEKNVLDWPDLNEIWDSLARRDSNFENFELPKLCAHFKNLTPTFGICNENIKVGEMIEA